MFDAIEDFDPPFYLFENTVPCWDCGTDRPVVGLAAGDVQPFILTEITALPDDLLESIRSVQPAYEWRASRSTGRGGYRNVCHCGAHFGDFFLFSRPGGAFFPRTPDEARAIRIYSLPLVEPLHIECNPGLGTGRMILEFGHRVPFPKDHLPD